MKGTTTITSIIGRRRLLAGALGSLAAITFGGLALDCEASLGRQQLSHMVSFGDSLSDTGNFYRATGETLPPAPYADGRASNGPLWNERLASYLRIPLHPADQYAWFGALTGDTNLNSNPAAGVFFPGFEQQVDLFLSDVGETGADPHALYTIWIGANDFLAWSNNPTQPVEQVIAAGIGNTAQGVARLAGAGARHFVIGNLPNLGLTPAGLSQGPQNAAGLTHLALTYNTLLEAQLAQLEQALDIRITILDAFEILTTLAGNPDLFRFENVTEAAITSFPEANPDRYLFWDAVHPTARGHSLTALFGLRALMHTYLPERVRPHFSGHHDNAKPALYHRQRRR